MALPAHVMAQPESVEQAPAQQTQSAMGQQLTAAANASPNTATAAPVRSTPSAIAPANATVPTPMPVPTGFPGNAANSMASNAPVAAPVASSTPAAQSSSAPATAAPPPATSTPSPAPTATPAAATINVSADSLLYDGARSTIIARGNVIITTNHGISMHARYFAMNVNQNRYVLAGHVHIEDGQGTKLDGAAFATLLNFDRSYYLPVLNGPDRWTYKGDDLEHPLKGRIDPGDAFALPDEPHGRVWIASHFATIVPEEHILFGPGKLDTGVTVVPVPRYFLNISRNPNFAENSLYGAHWDASYPFAGSSNTTTTFHLREASGIGIMTGIEQHLVSDKGYLVGSIEPLDHEQKQYNLLGSYHPAKKLELDSFVQESLFQQGLLAQPLNASAFIDVRATQSLRGSYVQGEIDQWYQGLMGDPHNGCECYQNNPDHAFVPNHPVQMEVNWVGFDQRIKKLPLHYRLRSGFGYAHQLQGFTPLPNSTFATSTFAGLVPGTQQYPSIVGGGVKDVNNNYFGGTLYSSPILVNRDKHGNPTNLIETVDAQHQTYSLPHNVDTISNTLSLSKTYGTKFAAFASYTLRQVNDNYPNQALQSIAYAPDANLPGFHGFATYRDLAESLIFTPNPNFTFTLIAQQNNDFPRPVAYYFGQPPGLITGDVRARLLPHLLIDVSRSYYLPTFGGMHWSNQFGVLLGS